MESFKLKLLYEYMMIDVLSNIFIIRCNIVLNV